MKDNFLWALLAAGGAFAAYQFFGQRQQRAAVQRIASPFTNLGTARPRNQIYRPGGLVPVSATNGAQAAAKSQSGIPFDQLIGALGSAAQTAVSIWRNRERVGTPTGLDDWHDGLSDRGAAILAGAGTGNPSTWVDTPVDTGLGDDFWTDPDTGGFGDSYDGQAIV